MERTQTYAFLVEALGARQKLQISMFALQEGARIHSGAFSEMSNPHVIPDSRIKRYEKDLKARIKPRIHLENDVYLTNSKCYLVLSPFKISSLP